MALDERSDQFPLYINIFRFTKYVEEEDPILFLCRIEDMVRVRPLYSSGLVTDAGRYGDKL